MARINPKPPGRSTSTPSPLLKHSVSQVRRIHPSFPIVHLEAARSLKNRVAMLSHSPHSRIRVPPGGHRKHKSG
jgi:hypothetical protein